MVTLTLLFVDVFTTERFQGNACAVVVDADQLSDETMQQIARELNQAETAFILTSETADFRARFFTPAEEIPLAGHPTIASVFALLELDRLKPTPNRLVSVELRDGPVEVEIFAAKDLPLKIMMAQRKPEFKQVYEPSAVLEIFGLAQDDLLPQCQIQTVSTGTPQLMIPLRSLESLQQANLHVDAYREFQRTADFFSPHLFCLQGATEAGQSFARHFGVPPDLPEDAFTGSATGGMAAYLWRYGLIEHPTFVAEQGHWMGRPGFAFVEIAGPRDDISSVRVGGHSVTAFRGELTFAEPRNRNLAGDAGS